LLDGSPTEAEQAALTAHLNGCARCRETLEGLASDRETCEGVAQRLREEAPPALTLLWTAIDPAGEGAQSALAGTELPPEFLGPPAQPGELGTLGPYRVLAVIGRGGMGVVLKALDERLGRVVAVKVLAPQLAASDTARRRFDREARAAAAVVHEHAVAIHGVGEAAGLPYMVMQYIAGVSLQQRLDRTGRLGLAEVLRIGMQTAAGLAAAHARGIVHRDVKPANILLEIGVERVKLTDFGLARVGDDISLTHSGVVAGTPMYMAPEQASGETVDPRSDLFSLGSVLYEACTGQPPFLAPNVMAALKRVCEETPRPVGEVNPEIPDWLAAIIAKLHAKKPADRFQTAAEVAELLGRCLAHVQNPSEVAPPSYVRPAAPKRRTRRWLWAAVGLLVLAGFAVAVASAFRAWSADRQIEAVRQQLQALNPGFDGQVRFHVVDGVVTECAFSSADVTDLSPLRALRGLRKLECPGVSFKEPSRLADLQPLRGLPLTHLAVHCSEVADLSPLEGMPLKELECWKSSVKDLSPLRGAPLTSLDIAWTPVKDMTPLLTDTDLAWLHCDNTPVTDLSPLRGKPLTELHCHNTGVTDLSPLEGMPLRNLRCNPDVARNGTAVLRSLHDLRMINETPREVWMKQEGDAAPPP
jgi:serine/threonine-protein kinase